MAYKDTLQYIAIAVVGVLLFILVGTCLVLKKQKDEEREKELREREGTGEDDEKKSGVRKRIGETDAFQEAAAAGKKMLNESIAEEEDPEALAAEKTVEDKKAD